MKKLLKIIVLSVMLIIFPNKIYAQGNIVEVKVNGEIKKDNTIEILVNFNNIEGLYAASIDYEYDNELVKVLGIEPSSFIKNDKVNIMEFGEETNKDGNKASYYFTCLGNQKGLSGTGNFVTIRAKILKDGNLTFNENNTVIKLAQKNDKNEIQELKYEFKVLKSSTSQEINEQSDDKLSEENINKTNNITENSTSDESNIDNTKDSESQINKNNNDNDNAESSLDKAESEVTDQSVSSDISLNISEDTQKEIRSKTINYSIFIFFIIIIIVVILLKKYKLKK